MSDGTTQLDYSIALQRIIERLCHGGKIHDALIADAPHHGRMAREFQIAHDALVEALKALLPFANHAFACPGAESAFTRSLLDALATADTALALAEADDE